MTDIEFMKEKNKIIREELGLKFDLIPESQMIELDEEQKKLAAANIDNENGGTSCLYCIVFDSCIGCPMNDAGNPCSDEGNTWVQYIDYCTYTDGVEPHFYCESKANERMSDLINKYKKGNL
jgi:hypothetical protein